MALSLVDINAPGVNAVTAQEHTVVTILGSSINQILGDAGESLRTLTLLGNGFISWHFATAYLQRAGVIVAAKVLVDGI